MKSNFHLILNLVMVIFQHGIFGVICSNETQASVVDESGMRYLTRSDYYGKTEYHADIKFKRTWEEANALCKSFGLSMATPKTENEAAVLKSDLLTMEGEVWIGAKSHLLHRAFDWDGRGNTVENYWSWHWHKRTYQPHYCLTINIGAFGYHTTNATVRPCSSKYGTLCQSVNK